METVEIFSKIHKNNEWLSNESVSGTGSEMENTVVLVNELRKFITSHNIKSIIDVPCGDLNWMKYLLEFFPEVEYTGGDIVGNLIEQNRKLFPKYNFGQVDITLNSIISVYDLLICRDCLVHLSTELVKSAIKNISKSDVKYIGLTSFTKQEKNIDIPTGSWRTLNLQIEPFNLPEPYYTINEQCYEANGMFLDKCLLIWKKEQLLTINC